MISVLGTDFFWEKHKNKVPHLLNRNFNDISEEAFSLGQLQQNTFTAIRLPHRRCDINIAQDRLCDIDIAQDRQCDIDIAQDQQCDINIARDC
jgi:hypothetical protein